MWSGTQEQMAQWLREGEVDLAITALEGRTGRGLEALSLLRLQPVLLVRSGRNRGSQESQTPTEKGTNRADERNSQASGAWDAITSAAVLLQQKTMRERLVCPTKSDCVARVFGTELQRRGIEWPATIELKSTALVTSCVAKGLGIGLTVNLRG